MGIIALALAHDWPEGSQQLRNSATFHIGLGYTVLGRTANSDKYRLLRYEIWVFI